MTIDAAQRRRRLRRDDSPDHVDELPHRQVLLVSGVSRRLGITPRARAPISSARAACPPCQDRPLTAGTRYFFLSIVGMSLFSAFSQMTWRELARHAGDNVANRDPVWVLLSDPLRLGLSLVCLDQPLRRAPSSNRRRSTRLAAEPARGMRTRTERVLVLEL